MNETRRKFIAGAAGIATMSLAGCLGYVRTDANNYTIEDGGFTEDGVYVDAMYHGSKSGKVQYELSIEQNSAHVLTTRSSSREVKPDGTFRFIIEDIDTDVLIEEQETVISLIIVNGRDGADEFADSIKV